MASAPRISLLRRDQRQLWCRELDDTQNALGAELDDDALDRVVGERRGATIAVVLAALAAFEPLACRLHQRCVDTEERGGLLDRGLDLKLAPQPADGVLGAVPGRVVDRRLWR
jgi:hypothetical protein